MTDRRDAKKFQSSITNTRTSLSTRIAFDGNAGNIKGSARWLMKGDTNGCCTDCL